MGVFRFWIQSVSSHGLSRRTRLCHGAQLRLLLWRAHSDDHFGRKALAWDVSYALRTRDADAAAAAVAQLNRCEIVPAASCRNTSRNSTPPSKTGLVPVGGSEDVHS